MKPLPLLTPMWRLSLEPMQCHAMPSHADDQPAVMFAGGNVTLWLLANRTIFGFHGRSLAIAVEQTYQPACVRGMMCILLDKT